MKRLLLAALPLLAPAMAVAQVNYPTAAGPGIKVGGTVPLQCDATGKNCAPVAAANPVPVSGSTVPTGTAGSPSTAVVSVQGVAGGTAQPASIANGADAATGNTADAAYAGSGSASVVAALKGVYAATLLPLAAGTNAIGTVTAVGNVASGAADSGNGVKAACVYNASQPSYSTGQRGDCQIDNNGNLRVIVFGPQVGGVLGDGSTNSVTRLVVENRATVYNGSTWDRMPGSTVGTFTVPTPTAVAGNALAPVVTGAVAASLVLKAAAGNLYGLNVTTGATAGYLLLFDAVSAPADGAVTPKRCLPIGAATGVEINYRELPMAFATGIVAVFSTTGCFTKTASATAFIAGDAK